jgi:AcrR family transcriptional regulator
MQMRSMTDSHARELHAAIIAAATIAFVERGFAAATMEDIATRAETTRRTLYKHFPTKEDIFFAMVEAGTQQFLGGLGQPADYGRTPVKAITIYAARFLELSACSYTIAFQRMVLAAGVADASNRIYQAAYAPAYERLAVYLREQFRADGKRKDYWFALAQNMLEAATGAERTAILFGAKQPLPSPPLSIPGASCDLTAIERIVNRQLATLVKR